METPYTLGVPSVTPVLLDVLPVIPRQVGAHAHGALPRSRPWWARLTSWYGNIMGKHNSFGGDNTRTEWESMGDIFNQEYAEFGCCWKWVIHLQVSHFLWNIMMNSWILVKPWCFEFRKTTAFIPRSSRGHPMPKTIRPSQIITMNDANQNPVQPTLFHSLLMLPGFIPSKNRNVKLQSIIFRTKIASLR